MIVADKLVKKYTLGGDTITALNEVSLTINKGEFTAIMGPSGSGKSTFMNILGCLDVMDSGRYLIDGKDISTMKEYELAKIRNEKIGFVFQAFNLLPKLNILENVELPMIYLGISSKDRRKRALEALDKVKLADRTNHKPNEISGGQKQRVAIARAIVNNPSIIMADEPTGNLDSVVSEEIMKIFQDLNDEGTTILMVTHEKDIANHCKRIINFKDGKIIEDNRVKDRTIL